MFKILGENFLCSLQQKQGYPGRNPEGIHMQLAFFAFFVRLLALLAFFFCVAFFEGLRCVPSSLIGFLLLLCTSFLRKLPTTPPPASSQTSIQSRQLGSQPCMLVTGHLCNHLSSSWSVQIFFRVFCFKVGDPGEREVGGWVLTRPFGVEVRPSGYCPLSLRKWGPSVFGGQH